MILCAVLLLPVTYATPPKARVVAEPHRKTAAPVSASPNSTDKKEKATTPKVVTARPVPSKKWRWVPKFQKSGKEDTTWGFLFRRPF
jgi:hypothetical protein